MGGVFVAGYWCGSGVLRHAGVGRAEGGGGGGGRGWAGKVWTVDEMACFLSLLEVDVDIPVTMPRQVLAALAELHGGATDSVLRRRGGRQVQFFDKG